MILDLGPPDAGGRTVLREIRGWSQVPVLVLSVRADEAGKVAALDAGAQDCVVKPFGINERLARIRSLLRGRAPTSTPALIEIIDLRIDSANHTVTKQGLPLHLTRRGFDLLWPLASHAGRLVTQAMILKSLWGLAHAEGSQYMRASCARSLAMILPTPATS